VPIRPIRQFPDPILKKNCQPVVALTLEVSRALNDLVDTLNASPGVGLSLPQIGFLWQGLAVDVSRRKKGGAGHGRIVLLNPRVVSSEGEQVFREGCLSIPDFLADVKRARRVRVEGMDVSGLPVRWDVEDFEAVVFQHEIDHLSGILFLDRVSNAKTDVFRRKKP